MDSNPIALLKEAIKPPVAPEDFRVFVFGPALKPLDTVAAPPTGARTQDDLLEHARYLRYLTKVELEKLGFTVDFGETIEVTQFWSEQFRSDGIGQTEMLHASRGCGAIVIFPSSIGSISELALLARDRQIAEKTVAIVHSKYEHEQSFFRLGVVDIFEVYNGRPKFVDYEDHRTCVQYAVRFVKGLYGRVISDIHDVQYKGAKYRGTVFQNATQVRAD